MAQSEIFVMFDFVTTTVERFNHVPGGSNFLFLDGHVEFARFGQEPATRADPLGLPECGPAPRRSLAYERKPWRVVSGGLRQAFAGWRRPAHGFDRCGPDRRAGAAHLPPGFEKHTERCRELAHAIFVTLGEWLPAVLVGQLDHREDSPLRVLDWNGQEVLRGGSARVIGSPVAATWPAQ